MEQILVKTTSVADELYFGMIENLRPNKQRKDLSFGRSGASACARVRAGAHCCVLGLGRNRTCFVRIRKQEPASESQGAGRIWFGKWLARFAATACFT